MRNLMFMFSVNWVNVDINKLVLWFDKVLKRLFVGKMESDG